MKTKKQAAKRNPAKAARRKPGAAKAAKGEGANLAWLISEDGEAVRKSVLSEVGGWKGVVDVDAYAREVKTRGAEAQGVLDFIERERQAAAVWLTSVNNIERKFAIGGESGASGAYRLGMEILEHLCFIPKMAIGGAVSVLDVNTLRKGAAQNVKCFMDGANVNVERGDLLCGIGRLYQGFNSMLQKVAAMYTHAGLSGAVEAALIAFEGLPQYFVAPIARREVVLLGIEEASKALRQVRVELAKAQAAKVADDAKPDTGAKQDKDEYAGKTINGKGSYRNMHITISKSGADLFNKHNRCYHFPPSLKWLLTLLVRGFESGREKGWVKPDRKNWAQYLRGEKGKDTSSLIEREYDATKKTYSGRVRLKIDRLL